MKAGWKYVKLGEVCEILDKKRQPITKSKRVAGKFPYYGATGLLDYVAEYIFDEKLVLLGEDGAKWGAGEKSSFIIEGKSWVNNHAHVLRPNRTMLVDEYLIYFLNYTNLLEYVTGATIPKLNQERMKSIPIPLPSLLEQGEIVAYLDKEFALIDALREKATQQLQATKDLFQTQLKQLLTPKQGWEEKKINSIGEVRIGPFGSLLHKSDYVLGGVPLINPMHIIGGVIQADINYSVSLSKASELSAYQMKTKDIVLGRRGEMGRCAVVEDSQSGFLCGTGCIFFRPNPTLVNPYFLSLLLQSVEGVTKLSNVAGGATMQNLSSKAFGSIFVSLPPLSEQEEIVRKLDALSEQCRQLEENYRQTISLCNDLKQAVLRQVFTT